MRWALLSRGRDSLLFYPPPRIRKRFSVVPEQNPTHGTSPAVAFDWGVRLCEGCALVSEEGVKLPFGERNSCFGRGGVGLPAGFLFVLCSCAGFVWLVFRGTFHIP